MKKSEIKHDVMSIIAARLDMKSGSIDVICNLHENDQTEKLSMVADERQFVDEGRSSLGHGLTLNAARSDT